MKEIRVKSKNVYGNLLLYPNCETSQLFCDIAGTKTLSCSLVTLLVKRGYSIIEIP